MIDWDLAVRVGGLMSGSPGASGIDPGFVERTCRDALESVAAYSQMTPLGPVPPGELVDRREWIAANAASMSALLDPVAARIGPRPGTVRDGVRLIGEATVTLEAGSMLGLLSRKVLGQYDMRIIEGEDDPPPRLLFVAPNLAGAMAGFGADGDDFLRWVALHEVTHAVQFGSVPWLRDHLGGLAGQLVELLDPASAPQAKSVAGRVAGAAGRVARSLRDRDPVALVVGPAERLLVDRLQAAMSLVEGHAEHVMDRADPAGVPSLRRLRSAMLQRRASQGPLWRVLGKVLGLDLKVRQYEQGRAFCDRVVGAAGIDGLNLAWQSPESLPDLAEISEPELWLARVAG